MFTNTAFYRVKKIRLRPVNVHGNGWISLNIGEASDTPEQILRDVAQVHVEGISEDRIRAACEAFNAAMAAPEPVVESELVAS